MQFVLPQPVSDMLEPGAGEAPSDPASAYARWRPRLMRGAAAAGVGAFLSKTLSNHSSSYSPHIAVPTIAAGLLGVADAAIEEKMRQQHPELASAGYDKRAHAADPRTFSPEVLSRAEDDSNGLLGDLFARKDRVGSLARAQLGSLFPEGARADSYGRQARLRPGHGSLAELFEGLFPRTR